MSTIEVASIARDTRRFLRPQHVTYFPHWFPIAWLFSRHWFNVTLLYLPKQSNMESSTLVSLAVNAKRLIHNHYCKI